MAPKEIGVVAALKQIEAELVKASGYPDNTVQDGTLAFAYGLVLGTVSKLRDEWKEKLRA